MRTRSKIELAVTAIISLGSAVAAPVATWKEFNPNAAVVPISDANTSSPTFGDGVTTNSSQQAWIGARFGDADAPVSVTLAVGETLTVSGSVVLTGGTNNNNQISDDEKTLCIALGKRVGQFALKLDAFD